MKNKLRKWLLKFLELDEVHKIYKDKTCSSLTNTDIDFIDDMICNIVKGKEIKKVVININDTNIGRKIIISQIKKDLTCNTVEAECIYNGNRIDFMKRNGGN